MDNLILERLQSIERKLDLILQQTTKQNIFQEPFAKDKLQTLIGLDKPKDSIRYLKLWLKDAENLVIADPYLYSFKPTKFYAIESEYANAFIYCHLA
jgi:hypothetical protein